jgi:muramoyltetrapeptide carboxypeptidase LdcA involved in peptidoglycan recycling
MTVLREAGAEPVSASHIYARTDEFSGTDEERAADLMEFYKDGSIAAIYDISGGDLANGVLNYLDFDLIARSDKTFWGYSDLTTIINAIYAKTGNSSVLYQVRNLVSRCKAVQQEDFFSSMLEGSSQLFTFDHEFVHGKEVCGIVVGGNIRCLLKLAGTEYWPDMKGKILFLEARSGQNSQMTNYLSHLKQLGVFDQIHGLVLGTFSELETCVGMPQMKDLIAEYIDENLPLAMTREVGHGADSKAIRIGEKMNLKKRK